MAIEIVDLPIKNGGFPSKIMAPPSGSPPRRDQSRGAAPCRRLLKVVLGEAFRLEKNPQEFPMKMQGICKSVYNMYIYIYIMWDVYIYIYTHRIHVWYIC